jgi:hypothetical protein
MGQGIYGTYNTVPKFGAGGAAQPGTVKPKMSKLYDGRNVATRPIPIITDSSDLLAMRAAAADQRPKGYAVNMPSAPHPVSTAIVFGAPVTGATHISAGVWNPATGLGEHT